MAAQGPLIRAQTALRETLKDGEARLLFGAPVDPIALGLHDYFDIIKEPRDLGTTLAEVTACIKGRSAKYSQPSQVLADVELVWENCNTYNFGNEEILEACDRVRKLFEQQWRAAGLSLEDGSPPPQPGAHHGGDAAPAPEGFEVKEGKGAAPRLLLLWPGRGPSCPMTAIAGLCAPLPPPICCIPLASLFPLPHPAPPATCRGPGAAAASAG